MTDPQTRGATLSRWLAAPVTPDVERALERLRVTDAVRRVAVMPDVHLAEDVCVGAVVATRERILPQAIGCDIGCGMAALRFETNAELLADERSAAKLLAGLGRTVPVARHPRATMPAALPEPLASEPLSDARLERMKARDGRVELGTLGRGNHFLEFQRDEQDRLWLMLHSGSRAMGQAIHRTHVERALASNTGLRYLDSAGAAGGAYLSDVEWALGYAEASRRAMLAAVEALMAELFGVVSDRASLLTCNHNHARRETHGGEELWVHRKGAISAGDGEPGIIPGSMGTASYHVLGRGLDDALASSSHGAGRCESRSNARRRVSERVLLREMRGIWFDHRSAARLRDEAPSAYKEIGPVMRAQRDLTRIVRRLEPILVYKGCKWTRVVARPPTTVRPVSDGNRPPVWARWSPLVRSSGGGTVYVDAGVYYTSAACCTGTRASRDAVPVFYSAPARPGSPRSCGACSPPMPGRSTCSLTTLGSDTRRTPRYSARRRRRRSEPAAR